AAGAQRNDGPVEVVPSRERIDPRRSGARREAKAPSREGSSPRRLEETAPAILVELRTAHHALAAGSLARREDLRRETERKTAVRDREGAAPRSRVVSDGRGGDPVEPADHV